MSDRPDLKTVPPLPAEIMGVMSNDEFETSVVEFSSTGKPWSMRDMNDAEYAARRLVASRAVIEAVRVQAEAWMESIIEWASAQSAADREVAAWAEASLTAFALRFREQTDQATLKLPSLTVRTREVPGGVVVEDMDAFVEWAKANRPEAIKTEWKPIAKEVAKLDEKLPGLGYREDRVSVTL